MYSRNYELLAYISREIMFIFGRPYPLSSYLGFIGPLIRKAGRGVFFRRSHRVGRSLEYCPIIFSEHKL
jgi:hypothetical protein